MVGLLPLGMEVVSWKVVVIVFFKLVTVLSGLLNVGVGCLEFG